MADKPSERLRPFRRATALASAAAAGAEVPPHDAAVADEVAAADPSEDDPGRAGSVT